MQRYPTPVTLCRTGGSTDSQADISDQDSKNLLTPMTPSTSQGWIPNSRPGVGLPPTRESQLPPQRVVVPGTGLEFDSMQSPERQKDRVVLEIKKSSPCDQAHTPEGNRSLCLKRLRYLEDGKTSEKRAKRTRTSCAIPGNAQKQPVLPTSKRFAPELETRLSSCQSACLKRPPKPLPCQSTPSSMQSLLYPDCSVPYATTKSRGKPDDQQSNLLEINSPIKVLAKGNEKKACSTSPDQHAQQRFIDKTGIPYTVLSAKVFKSKLQSGTLSTRHIPCSDIIPPCPPLSRGGHKSESRDIALNSNRSIVDSKTHPKPALAPNILTESLNVENHQTPCQLNDLGKPFGPDPCPPLSGSNLETIGKLSINEANGGTLYKSTSVGESNSVSLVKQIQTGALSLVLDAKPISLSMNTLDPKILTPQFVRLGYPVNGLKNCPSSSTIKIFKKEAVQPESRPELSPCGHRYGLGENRFVKAEAVSKNSPPIVPLFPSDEDNINRLNFTNKEPQLNPQDDELDLDLALGLDLDLHLSDRSSRTSEDDELLSLQEILDFSVQPPDTPEKGLFSTPGTPVLVRHQSKLLPIPPTKPGNYKNTLELMLKEKATNQRSKEIEMELLLSCEENLLHLAENEQSEDNQEEAISNEHKEFLQRYPVISSAIRDSHPGEELFNLDNFSRLFNENTLQLRGCNANPQETAQKTLLWSSPSQLRFHISVGLLGAAYNSSPCPPQITRLLFQMMSVHSEMMISNKILQDLRSIAYSAAEQIVTHKNKKFEVWMPLVADVTLVLMNMGVPFVSIFPVETIQPTFGEGDLLEDLNFCDGRSSLKGGKKAFPFTNFDNVIKYLTTCTALCPWAYTNAELLLLLTMVSRVSLDTQLILQPTRELRALLHNLVNNFRNWDNMLPKICLALTHMTDDHHNLRWLLQLLPDETRGKQLRRHLSVSMISKLLNQTCTYLPTNTEFQLSDLRRYLPRMRPSALLKVLQCSHKKRTQGEKEDNDSVAALDQQAYYLCYSLLALANEASNYEFFPPHQKDQLLLLCAELEKHIKCDIRESEKCLYRSKVKDFVARIYTKWQVLLQRTRPLQGKLYDYWRPLPEDALCISQETQNTPSDDETEEREGEEEESLDDDDEKVEVKKVKEIKPEDFSLADEEDKFIYPIAKEEFEDEQEMDLTLEELQEDHENQISGKVDVGIRDKV